MRWSSRRYDSGQMHLRRSACAAFGLLGVLASQSEALAAEAVRGAVCEITVGLQGRIESVTASSGVRAKIQVERNGHLYPGRPGCFLVAGDIVRPALGVTAAVSLPEGGSTVQVDSAHPLTIPRVNPPNYLQSVVGMLREILGGNGENARTKVTGQVGMRSADDEERGPLLIPGISSVEGLGPQSVARELPLALRWRGGVAPFQLEWVTSKDSPPIKLQQSSARSARLDMSSLGGGPAELRILSVDGNWTGLRINLVSRTERPVDARIPTSLDRESWDLVEASWLLTRGPGEWRLEALSELQILAVDHNNLVARAILDPKAAAEEPYESLSR
jgi:hypothetical protein